LKRETESGPDICPEGTREGAQDAQGALVMILELAGSDHPDRQDFAVAGPGATIGVMPHGASQVVKDDVDGYNQRVVHRSFLRRKVVSATAFSDRSR
jgi:hypothetical protein